MNYLFISIPRTGTQSVRDILPTKDNHVSIKKHEGVNAFSFCFLREPIERLHSWYSFHYTNYRKNYLIYNRTFEEWILAGCPHHWNNFTESAVKDPLNQSEFILDSSGNIAVDFVGVFSKLKSQVNVVLGLLNIQKQLPHISKTGRGEPFISEAAMQLVKNRYKKDFELYQYFSDFWNKNDEASYIKNIIKTKYEKE